jgi:hypothetical protein
MRLSDKIAWVSLQQPHHRPAPFFFRVYYLSVISLLAVGNAMIFFQARGPVLSTPGSGGSEVTLVCERTDRIGQDRGATGRVEAWSVFQAVGVPRDM